MISHTTGKPTKLGKPLQRTANNHLLFRVGGDISLRLLGARVVDSTMAKTVGTVFDIFGPVENPFLSVRLQGSKETGTTEDLSSSYFAILEQRRSGSKKSFATRKYPKKQ
jgi:rRNA processing protein Gar1